MNLDNPLPPEQVELPSNRVLNRLKISPEVAFYLISRDIGLPESPPKVKTPEPSKLKGAIFSPQRVDKVLRSMHVLRHTQGDFAGKPLDPLPWQVAYIFAPVFGWIIENEDRPGSWVRVVRNVTIDVSRKAGKSTICGAIALYLTGADDEQGAQVLAAATTKDQARFVFDPIKQLAESTPALSKFFTSVKTSIMHNRSYSSFKVVSSAADAQHGANIHGAVIDEIHVHKKKDLIDVLESGTGSRSQPLIFKITTADEGRANTPYSINRDYIEKLSRGTITDYTTYGAIFAAGDDDDPFKESTWKKANPGYGVTPTKAFMRAEANKAKNSPAQLARFKRLHLGIRTKENTAWIEVKDWKRNAGKKIVEEDLKGRIAYGGLDLASVSDLTALCWLMPFTDENGVEGYDAIWRFWTPEDNLTALDERTGKNASIWVKQGWLTLTPGNVTDYDFICDQVNKDMDLLDVQSIGYDRWNSSQLVNDLMEDGAPMVKVGQGYATMNSALVELQRLVKKGAEGKNNQNTPRLRHGGNPVALWCIDNLAVDMDPAGNVKPSKANSSEKIDGVSALLDALSEGMLATDTRSAYEEYGVRAV